MARDGSKSYNPAQRPLTRPLRGLLLTLFSSFSLLDGKPATALAPESPPAHIEILLSDSASYYRDTELALRSAWQAARDGGPMPVTRKGDNKGGALWELHEPIGYTPHAEPGVASTLGIDLPAEAALYQLYDDYLAAPP